MTTTTLLCLFSMMQVARAAERPTSHRHMLSERLTRDMNDTRSRGMPKAFSEEDRRRARELDNLDTAANLRVSEEDAELLDQYYDLLRHRVKQDVTIIQNLVKHGEPADAEIERWESDREELAKLAAKLAAKSEAVKWLANLAYGSVPGFSLREFKMLPQMYYVFNDSTGELEYVGPAADAGFAELSSPWITAESPLYVPWVDVNRDHYKHWLEKHHDVYSRLAEKEPRLADAVRGEPAVKSSGASHDSGGSSSHGAPNGASHSSGGALAHGSPNTTSHSSGGSIAHAPATSHASIGSWGATPARMAPIAPTFRSGLPNRPRF